MKKEFRLAAHSDQLTAFRRELEHSLHEMGLYEKGAGEVILAVDEALTNVIRHSYGGRAGEVHIVLQGFEDRVEIQIRDFGEKFVPSKIPAPELPPKRPGGLGLYLIKTLTDKSEYSAAPQGGNQLLLTKYKKNN